MISIDQNILQYHEFDPSSLIEDRRVSDQRVLKFTGNTALDYIERVSDYAIDGARGTGIFPSVAMAQGALESGWGRSGLAKNHGNQFGIKADKSWKGPTVTMDTTEFLNGNYVTVSAQWRKYSNIEDSFRDHISFLQRNPRYAKAGVFDAKTPEEQARALQQAGYATDPGYADKLIGLIKKYNLKTLDRKAEQKKKSGRSD